MNNLPSYCGLTYSRISASEKDLPVSDLVDKRKDHKIVSLEIRKYYCSLSQYFFGCSKSKADNGNCAVIGAVFFPNEKMF